MTSNRFLLAIGMAAVAVYAAVVSAQQIPALETIPAALPNPPRGGLERRYAELAKTRDSLRARILAHDAVCHSYGPNSLEARTCPPETAQLAAERDTYVLAVTSFKQDREQAIRDETIKRRTRLEASNAAIARDASAVRQIGFARRADDFAEWDTLSTEAHEKLKATLWKVAVDQASDRLVDGFLESLQKLDLNGQLKALEKLNKAGLGSTRAARQLRAMTVSRADRKAWNALAKLLYDDLKDHIDALDHLAEGQNLEALADFLKTMAPGVVPLADATETAVWAVYDASAQGLALYEVGKLNEMTTKQLGDLQGLRCVYERHAMERYEATKGLRALTGEGQEPPSPMLTASCGK